MANESRKPLARLARTLRALRWPAVAVICLVLLARIAAGPMARELLEGSLEDALGADVDVRQVRARWLGGPVTAQGISLAGPPGFRSELATFDRVRADVPLTGFFGREVDVPSIVVDRARVTLEVRGERVNLVEALASVRRAASETAADAEGAPVYRVGEFTVESLEVELRGDIEPSANPLLRTITSSLSFEAGDAPVSLPSIVERILLGCIDSVRTNYANAVSADVLEELEHAATDEDPVGEDPLDGDPAAADGAASAEGGASP